ncbi:MAG: hypothetical protein KatS3mg065_0028 [Chloroflexota bacterium]|nr:MAG: hypothetical protein KatS3mg065_0028 [Chloroflexota bacterium]
MAALAALVGLAGALLAPPGGPASVRAGAPSDGSTLAPDAAARPYEIRLLGPGDFVSQTNDVQCIGASIQTMANIVGLLDDRSAATQRRIQDLARRLSWLPGDPVRRINWEPRGASTRGWARALTELEVGTYILRSEATLDAALLAAARAMRTTNRPVGLLVWRGRHAWVMTGFRATADPLADPNAVVTAVQVADPWYPRTSSPWGRSPAPGTMLSPTALGRAFVPISRRWLTTPGERYVLIFPLVGPPQPHSDRTV